MISIGKDNKFEIDLTRTNSLILNGPSATGKTELIKQIIEQVIADESTKDAIIMHITKDVNFESLDTSLDFVEKEIATRLKAFEGIDWYKVDKEITKNRKLIVMILDDANMTELMKDPDRYNRIKNILNTHGLGIVMIMSGQSFTNEIIKLAETTLQFGLNSRESQEILKASNIDVSEITNKYNVIVQTRHDETQIIAI